MGKGCAHSCVGSEVQPLGGGAFAHIREHSTAGGGGGRLGSWAGVGVVQGVWGRGGVEQGLEHTRQGGRLWAWWGAEGSGAQLVVAVRGR